MNLVAFKDGASEVIEGKGCGFPGHDLSFYRDLVTPATREHERNTVAINRNTHQFIARTGTSWRAAVEAETNG